MMPPGHMIQHLCELADKMGYKVRMEMLGGSGGPCEIRGTRYLFVDTSLDPMERVEQVAQALCNDPGIEDVYVLPEVREYLRKVQDQTHP